MQVEKIPRDLFEALNQATRGNLSRLKEHFARDGTELQLSVVTHLEGLPDKEMRLYVTAFREGKTVFFAQPALDGPARQLGWNLYLTEKLSEVEGHIKSALTKTDALQQLARPPTPF